MSSNQKPFMNENKCTTPIVSSALLGCPWCGEQPEYQPASQSAAHPQYGWPHTLVHNCAVAGNLCLRTDTLKIEDTKEVLFKAWNTRKQPNASNSATGDRGASPAKADGKA